MLAKILILSLLVSSMFAKSIEVVPAKIDFKNNMEVDIVEEIYMMIHNGISSYNSEQDEAHKLISVKESFLPIRKYKKKINNYYAKNKSSYKQKYMQDNKLDYVVEYRVRRKDIKALNKCKRHCKVDIQVFMFKRNSAFSKDKLTLYFDTSVSSLTDDSYTQVDQYIISKLN